MKKLAVRIGGIVIAGLVALGFVGVSIHNRDLDKPIQLADGENNGNGTAVDDGGADPSPM